MVGAVVLALASGLACTRQEELVADWREATPGSECSVHGVFFEVDIVPIAYGLVVFPEGYREARASSFPNENLSMEGGCIGGDAAKAKVKYCSGCRAAQEEWASDHAGL